MNVFRRLMQQGTFIRCNTWRLSKNQQPSVFFIEPFKKKYLQYVRRELQKQNHIDYNGEMYEPLRKTELERSSVVPDVVGGAHQIMISGGHFSDKVDTLVVLDENDLPCTLDCPLLYEKKFLSHVTVDKSPIKSTENAATTSDEKELEKEEVLKGKMKGELIQRIKIKFGKWKVHHKVMPLLFPYSALHLEFQKLV